MKIPKYIPINQMDPLFQVSRSLFWFNLFYRYSNQMVVLVLFYTLLWFGHLDVYIILHYIIYKHTHIHIHIHIHTYIYILYDILYDKYSHDRCIPSWRIPPMLDTDVSGENADLVKKMWASTMEVFRAQAQKSLDKAHHIVNGLV